MPSNFRPPPSLDIFFPFLEHEFRCLDGFLLVFLSSPALIRVAKRLLGLMIPSDLYFAIVDNI